MADPIKPALRKAFGNDAWGFTPGPIENIFTPQLAELDDALGFNLSCSLFREQEGITSETEKVTLPGLLCETTDYEVNGATKYSLPDLQIAWQPQADPGSDGKLAWETLEDNIEGYLWRRQDVPATEPLADGQYVDVIPVQLGVKTPDKTGTDAAGVYAFTQPASIVGAPAYNVPIGGGASS